jgi:diacylglycerol kinase (ATP)
MAASGLKGIARMLKACIYSWQGLRAAWRHEAAFREEIGLSLLLIPLGLYLGENGQQKALLVASVMLIPLVEILNSAIEAAVDRHGSEQHELSGRAKDMGSAAVALSIALMLVVWILVLFVD